MPEAAGDTPPCMQGPHFDADGLGDVVHERLVECRCQTDGLGKFVVGTSPIAPWSDSVHQL